MAIEQASTLGWDRYVGDGGAVVGMHTFGASAPLKQLLVKFGFTPDRVTEVARQAGGRRQRRPRPRTSATGGPMRWTVHGERSVYDSHWLSLRLVDVEVPGR